MRRFIENDKNIVEYSWEELQALPRLPGARRQMTDEEITAAAMSDPDCPIPSEEEGQYFKTLTSSPA